MPGEIVYGEHEKVIKKKEKIRWRLDFECLRIYVEKKNEIVPRTIHYFY